MKDGNCEDLISRSWTNVCGCVESLKSIQGIDHEFKKYRSSEVKKEIIRIEKLLKQEEMWNGDAKSIKLYKELERQHADLLKTEETLWCQRSRAIWLQEGDKNTKFFHGKVSQRSKTNEIKKLTNEFGSWGHGQEKVESILLDYFSRLFSSSLPSDSASICQVVGDRLKKHHKNLCALVFTSLEVKEAIDQMHPLKAPGLDGLPALFFQHYWHIVGRDVTTLVLGILNDGTSMESINKTFIVLIPK